MLYSLYIKHQLFCIWETPKHNEDPDKMPHHAAFHQCLHCLLTLRYQRSSDNKKNIFF